MTAAMRVAPHTSLALLPRDVFQARAVIAQQRVHLLLYSAVGMDPVSASALPTLRWNGPGQR
jgi:hypothetical protein